MGAVAPQGSMTLILEGQIQLQTYSLIENHVIDTIKIH
jgi:hypothetical protein